MQKQNDNSVVNEIKLLRAEQAKQNEIASHTAAASAAQITELKEQNIKLSQIIAVNDKSVREQRRNNSNIENSLNKASA